MDLSGRPLLDTAPDRALFAGRDDELSRLLSLVRQRLNVLLVGDRGSGKTSLLRRVAHELRERPDDEPPAFVEGRLADDVRTFLDLVRLRLGLSPRVRHLSAMEAAVAGFSSQPVLDDTLELPRLVSSLREACEGGQRVVLVDELAPAIARAIFGRLRDEVWQLPITWVIATTDTDAGELTAPPADAFFDVVTELAPLSEDAQRDLLVARLGAAGWDLAGQIADGNPRRLLALARGAVLEGGAAEELLRARSQRDALVAKLGRPASMLMAELESLGPVSASDERLLQRLGWTRSRAVQVFRTLEDNGLVTAANVKGEAGRPRRVYRLVNPLEAARPAGSAKR